VKIEKKLPFTEEGMKELTEAFEIVTDMVDMTTQTLQEYDTDKARKVLSDEYRVDEMERTLRDAHVERLNMGQCHPHSGLIFVELIHNLERIGDHCTNVAEAVLNDIEKVSTNLTDSIPS
jgi:phosphate:Na+ symporter